MNRETLLQLLNDVRDDKISTKVACERLALLPYEDLGFAKIDHHRKLRSGMPEVIYAAGKTPAQTAEIFARMAAQGGSVLATKADAASAAAVADRVPDATYYELAKCITLRRDETVNKAGLIAVVCAGTSDLPIAEEAAITAELFGCGVTRIADAGVAGLHRLLAHLPQLRAADAIIACAGMEGALPSVIGGLVAVPVIAVPTSIGYGASLGGVTALLSMLNSCSPNITVVNIDNGFGAGYVASLIVSRRYSQEDGDEVAHG
jgi:NCAIR mutase (PurE)-related protein